MAKGIYKGHYDATRTWNKVWNDKIPMAFVVSAGRSAGKTFSFSRLLYERYLNTGRKFILLVRNKNELGACAEGVMKGMLEVLYPNVYVDEKQRQHGIFSEIFAHTREESADGEEVEEEKASIGYVIPLKSAGQIKLVSSTFVDADCAFMDEFQPFGATNYLPDEVEMLKNLHGSLARGGGEHDRFFPFFMASNAINIFNPYFVATGLTKKIQPDTRLYVDNNGLVLYENVTVTDVIEKQAKNKFAVLFGDSEKIEDNTWLGETGACVEKPNGWGRAFYVATLMRGGKSYAVKSYDSVGLWYIDKGVDNTYPIIYNLDLNDNLNVPFIKSGRFFCALRDKFMKGGVRCASSECKSVIMDLFV